MLDGRKAPRDGVKLVHRGPVIPCESGLHASEHPMDALRYAPGPVLCLVECGGLIKKHGDPVDKIACSERTIVARMDSTTLLLEFARGQALKVAHLINNPPDVVLDFLITGDESMRAAAGAAAGAAARDAAWAAAWDAARDAAWDAARDAAGSAARAAAGAAARDAARAAARSDFRALVHQAFEDWL